MVGRPASLELEDKVRTMILTSGPSSTAPGNQQERAKVGAKEGEDVVGIKAQSGGGMDQPVSAYGQAPPGADIATALPTKPRAKRPNQAQRRQMSAQLSIPIDPRPPPPYTARPYMSPTSNGSYSNSGHYQNNTPRGHPHQPHQHQDQHQRQQHQQHHSGNGRVHQQQPGHKTSRPHSATCRPQDYSNLDPVPFPHLSGSWRPRDSPHYADGQAHATAQHHPSRGHAYTRSEGQFVRPGDVEREAAFLDHVAAGVLDKAEIGPADIAQKEAFRQRIELICRDVITRHELTSAPDFPPESVELRCFGSLASGFATKASDMDLGIVSPHSALSPDLPDSPIPRILEKALLDAGLGARLITRTRVPIIKLCERPTEKLRRDLLRERYKWEIGAGNDPLDDADDDLHDEVDIPADIDFKKLNGGEDSSRNEKPGAGIGDGHGEEGSHDQPTESLKQQGKQPLSSYYNTAKRVLRRIGARDLRNSNIRDFTEADFIALTSVCRAYVHGLEDETLRERLLNHTSLAFPQPPSSANARSLLGVQLQIEGEQIVMAWETRTFPEKDDKAEQECRRLIEAWRALQRKHDYGLDPLAYKKDLHVALGNLRKIPSVQILFLEQGLHEPAADYHRRAAKLLSDLGGYDGPLSPILPHIVEAYLAGIQQPDVRVATIEFEAAWPDKSLAAVATRHKTLHLALDYERAISRGFYSDEQGQVIRQYIHILRGPLVMGPSGKPVIPVAGDNAPTVSQIRNLADPSTLACNAPRDQYRDKLEFPSSGVGVQCDINFSAHLALQNTLLLRCYSHTDARVRPLVLFVKHWAKMRNINEAYRGTLNSYGYVLMMLHYLVNVVEPFLCPNLQELAPAPDQTLSPVEFEQVSVVKGRDVRFWREEDEIKRLAADNVLNQNQESLGHLLRGFFEYYAHMGMVRDGRHKGFDWGRDVLSLRTHGGLLSKQQKGWTGAKTVIHVQKTAAIPTPSLKDQAQGGEKNAAQRLGMESPNEAPKPVGAGHSRALSEVKEVRHRYLFAIEDPFELDHNVARTVTHYGIVSIRDEFRRSWRIIQEAGRGRFNESLLQDAKSGTMLSDQTRFAELLSEIHGPRSATRSGASAYHHGTGGAR